MKILFYTEPLIELNKPNFRINKIEVFFYKIITRIKSADPKLDIKLLIGEHQYKFLSNSKSDILDLLTTDNFLLIKDENISSRHNDINQLFVDIYNRSVKKSHLDVLCSEYLSDNSLNSIPICFLCFFKFSVLMLVS